jgi:hypothetical protein
VGADRFSSHFPNGPDNLCLSLICEENEVMVRVRFFEADRKFGY